MGERRVLVVAAHPDDEVLGAGGTIASLSDSGAEVRILLLGDGESSRPGIEAVADKVSARGDCARRAAAVLGATGVTVHALPDNAFDTVPLLDVVRLVEAELTLFPASEIYTHHGGDLNIDHEVTCRAVITAARPVDGPGPDLYAFEVRSSTDWSDPLNAYPFRPNTWRALGVDAVARKQAALREYEAEMRPWPHSRSFEAVDTLLRHRGAQVGVAAAEAFAALRVVHQPG